MTTIPVSGKTFAPWESSQVAALNAFQGAGIVHPFTCGGEECGAIIVAFTEGWRCPHCEYRQAWAHNAMLVIGDALLRGVDGGARPASETDHTGKI